MMVERLLQILIGVFIISTVLVGYLAVIERLLYPLPHRRQQQFRPWLWIAPAAILLLVFLFYPMVNTIYLSMMNSDTTRFVGLDNYAYIATDSQMRVAIGNNLGWLALFVPSTVTLGLLMAVLTDRIACERVVKAIMFLPMAISFVAAGVIWKFMYDYRPPGAPQTGTLNALWTGLLPGAQPQPWLIDPATNNLALIFVAVWMFVGFCMVILSSGLKGIPEELLEAARVDGANEWQSFFRVTLPLLRPTVAVVTITMMISALKVFDVVYVLTNGNYNTDVIGTRMYKELFSSRNFGHASAIAVVLLIAILPVMIANIRNLRAQESR
jgi:alpha-glucoside transport system permease protein